MATQLLFDAAAPSDLAAILLLLGRSGLPAAGFAEHIGQAIVAREGDAVVGVAAVELYADGSLLRSVAVEGGVQGRGIGKALTVAALEIADRRGVGDVFLLTTTAPDYFTRLGFTPVSRDDVPAGVRASVQFVAACPASAIVMRRRAGDGDR